MSVRSATGLLAILALVTGVRPRAGRAATPSCMPASIELDDGVRARWPQLAGRLRDAFANRDDVDGCARVRLAMRGETAVLVVTLPDGRWAERPVARPEDVIPMLEALLLVPILPAIVEPSTPSPPPAAERVEGPPSPVPARSAVVTPAEPPAVAERSLLPAAATAGPTPPPVRLELALLTGARIGGTQTSVGLGVLAQAVLRGWLIGLEGRVDRYQYLTRDAPLPAAELVVLGGRRWRFGTTSLDLVTGLAAVYQGTSTVEMRAPDGQLARYSTTSTVPRVQLGLRLGFAAGALLRPFVGLDGEAGPIRAPEGPLGDAPYLPRATAGLTVGATVGAP